MEFNSIGILITEDCNGACKMCCDSRGLVRGKTLNINELGKILNEIKQYKSITDIGITGGEPLLYKELVKYFLNFDFGRPVNRSIKTNGFWGANKVFVEEFLSEFQGKLTHISLSYDDFHKEFFNVEALINIIEISKKYNISTDVVGCFLKSTSKPGDILNEFGETAYLTTFLYQPVIKTGSAKYFEEKEYIRILNATKDSIRCINVQNPTLLVNPEFAVYPCCSQVIENTILEIGSLKENTLIEIVEIYKTNFVMNTLYTEDFSKYLRICEKYNIDYPEEIASPCEICEFLFKNDSFLKLLRKENFYENF